MGYYSNVAIAIEFPNEQHLKEFVAVHRIIPEHNEALKEWRIAGDTILYFKDADIKWYDDTKFVKACKAMLGDAEDRGYAAAFTRIGEESGDVEEESYDGEHEDYGSNNIVIGGELLGVRIAIAVGFETSGSTSMSDYVENGLSLKENQDGKASDECNERTTRRHLVQLLPSAVAISKGAHYPSDPCGDGCG